VVDRYSDLSARLLTHLVEAAGMKSDIENLRVNQNELTTRVLVSLGELSEDMKAIRDEISDVPESLSVCKADMRREIERDFPSRLDTIEMEKRIENQIIETDRQLSRQIAQVDNGAKERHASLNARIDGVEGKLDKQWIKIVTAVTVVMVLLGGLAWAIDNISGSVLKEHVREPIRSGSGQDYQRYSLVQVDTTGKWYSIGAYGCCAGNRLGIDAGSNRCTCRRS